MIILPDKNIPHAKILMPVFDKEWRTPSLAQPKDELGNENKTVFHINARSNDGVIIWQGWFEDRADFDAFLWAVALGNLAQERALWDLPTPNWQPYLGDLITYEFYTTTFLSSGAGSGNQTYTKPSDWSNSDNYIDAIGCGSSGGTGSTGGGGRSTGGGGGEFRRIKDLSLSGNATYAIGSGGSAATCNNNYVSGTAGGDVYFNGTTAAGASLWAKPGGTGSTATSGALTGASGGSGGTGAGGNANGGGSGTVDVSSTCSGGGGAAGPGATPSKTSTPGAGGTSANNSTTQTGTAGGQGDSTAGGAGGTANGGTGTAGTEYQASPAYGAGGGGGGRFSASNNLSAGSGANYGAGGGAAMTTNSIMSSGAGIQGLIVVNYAPAATGSFPNLAMMGM